MAVYKLVAAFVLVSFLSVTPAWYLAEMKGQGEYFVLHQDLVYTTPWACENEANTRDKTEAMWRWICVEVP